MSGKSIEKMQSISSKVLPKVPLDNSKATYTENVTASVFKEWRFWFEMPCACSLEVFYYS